MSVRRELRILVGMPFGGLRGGAERLLATFLLGARHQGLEVRLVLFERGELQAVAAEAGMAVELLDPGRFRNVIRGARTVARLRQLVREWQPDVIVSWLPRAHPYLTCAALMTHRTRRLLWWQHQLGAQERLARLCTALPGRVVCTSTAAQDAQAQLRPRRETEICRPGIDLGPKPDPNRVRALRRELEGDSPVSVVGIVGRLVDWKGQDRFVDAIAALRDQGQDAVGWIVGDSAYGLEPEFKERVLARVRDAGLEDAIRLIGYVPEPAAHMAAMDVLVNASRREPFGMTLLEAMSLEVPVVAVDAAGPQDIIEDGVTGILVPDGSPAALASGIARLLTDQALATSVARAGRARYECDFTAERFAERAADVLRAMSA